MTLRIEKSEVGVRTVYRISGRIGLDNLADLRAEVDGRSGCALDLMFVTLVDVDGVRFLSSCEDCGMELIHCSPYIREWIARERQSQKQSGETDGQ